LLIFLSVTFGKFTPYPLTAKQARADGWKKDASCSGSDQKKHLDIAMVFLLNGYMKICHLPTNIAFTSGCYLVLCH